MGIKEVQTRIDGGRMERTRHVHVCIKQQICKVRFVDAGDVALCIIGANPCSVRNSI